MDAKPKRPPRELKYENIDNGILRLRTKPSSKLAYSFIPAYDHPASIAKPGQPGGEAFLIFLSGLDNPKFIWQKVLDKLFAAACAVGAELPPMLFYDRYGVGGSDPEPHDDGKSPEEFHDCTDAVADLHQLIVQIMELKFNWDRHIDSAVKQHLPRIVFCAHSIGVSIARMFATAYPGVVQGIIMLDSAIADAKAEDMIPNPDDPVIWAKVSDGKSAWSRGGWPDETVLSKDVVRDAIRKTKASPISGYPMTTKEHLRWDHMPQQLPRADEPKLRGPTDHLPLITVLRNDGEYLAAGQARLMGIPKQLVHHSLVVLGHQFMDGLPYLQPKGKGKGPITVHKAGHMIHWDAPETVARELLELVALSSHVVAQDEKIKGAKTKSKI